MDAVVLGNVTLDIICQPVDELPRYESITFEQVAVTPGGCGSNVAIGLCALGVSTALVARVGNDDAARLVKGVWDRFGLDQRYVRKMDGLPTGISVGLVDSHAQPRFIHTHGANVALTVDDLNLHEIAREGARLLHIAGFFVLPGLMDGRLPQALANAQQMGLLTSLDVVRSKRIDDPTSLWPCFPYLDIFLCNQHEALRLAREEEPQRASSLLRDRGARAVIVKLGSRGCWLESEGFSGLISAPLVKVVDTTGAGDAFAAGLIHALLSGYQLPQACQAGNEAGARIVRKLGAIGGWLME